MKKTIVLLIAICVSTIHIVAQQVKIVKCNTPTINIGGNELSVGSSFDKNSTIKWSSTNQVIMVRNTDGRVIRLSAALSENGTQDIVSKLLQKQYAHLSSRGDEFPAGEYYVEDSLKIFINLEESVRPKLELLCKDDNHTYVYTPFLSDDGKYAIISNDIFTLTKKRRIECKLIGKIDNDTIDLSDLIVLIPLDDSLNERYDD